MKNRIFLLFLILLIFITPIKKNETKNLFLIYIAADNDLYNNALDDLNELKSGEKINSKIIALFDGIYDTKLLEIEKNKEEILKIYENLNSGDPQVLYSLIKFGISKYYPENIILILWGHGDGRNFKGSTFKGVCFDENSSDYLTIQEIKSVLENLYKNYRRKIDILMFDACFMQSIEVSYELRNFVDYIIGSQTYVPLDGFPYDDIFNNISKINDKNLIPQVIAKEIAESYFDSYNFGSQGKEEIQISVINTKETEKLLSFLKENLNKIKNKDSLINLRKNYLIPLNNKYVDFFEFYKNYFPEILHYKDELILIDKNSFKINLSGASFYFPEFYLPINLSFFKESGFENILWNLFSY
ncbi:MAG: clostripain-related cysteine peptidase [Caldisericia bacterium]|nr:clostripain-related cysteine peptidase [Caldisericia bacterium]